MSLYELTENYKHIEALMEVAEDPSLFLDTLEAIGDAIEVKAESVAMIMRNRSAEIEALKNEEKRLADKRKRAEKNIESLNKYLFNAMQTTGKTKFNSGVFSFAIRKNPPSLNVSDETNIPQDYYVPQPSKLDKATLKQAVLNGLVIEGVTVEQKESLRIG